MKTTLKFSLFVITFFVFNFKTMAADDPKAPKAVNGVDAVLRFQIDSIKNDLFKQGFVVVKEALMSMESEYEIPVIVPLNEGSWYHFVFIGDNSSKLFEVRMYDFNEKQVVYQKHYGNGMESNVIAYSYIPKFSEYHMIKPVQVNKKKKNMNGYILMFKKIK